jgi:antitoxin (DNA-binding transcriptional repressor) of toxin-antitoxin stability system
VLRKGGIFSSMRAVSLQEAKEHLGELVEEAVAGGEVVISLDVSLALRLEGIRRWKELSTAERRARLEILWGLLEEIHSLPVLDRRSTERILAGEQGESVGFKLKLEERIVAEKSGIDQEPVVNKARVFGLDQGKLVIPDDFDAPMPEIEQLFYGSDR